jgi:tetratricopeptide (TPR) repeat protein
MNIFQLNKDKLELKKSVKRRKKGEKNQLNLFSAEAEIHKLHQDSPFEEALYLDEENNPKAAELYLKAIEENDCAADAYCNLGIIEFEKENFIKSFSYFLSSLKIEPYHTESHFNLGNLYFLLEDFKLAKLHFQIVIELDPGFSIAYFNLSLTYAAENNEEEAEKYLLLYNNFIS